MQTTTPTPQKEQETYTVITFDDVVEFKYTLPGDEEIQCIERELTFVWEDTLEKFHEEHGNDKTYKTHTFRQTRARDFFLNQVEDRTDDLIEEVEEEIANKTKYGFEFTGQLHNDD